MTTFREPFPILYVADAERSVRFYVESFGFEVQYRWPEEGDLVYAFLRLEPLGIGISSSEGPRPDGPPQFELCLYVDDLDAAARNLRDRGATELMAPREEPWGERRAYFADPDGHKLHLAQELAR